MELPSSSSSSSSNTTTSTSEKRLSRLFSLRKASNASNSSSSTNPIIIPSCPKEQEGQEASQVREDSGEKDPLTTLKSSVPIVLSSPPSNLSHEALKRRHIIQTLVSSENNYVSSLQRLIQDYKKPLEASSPGILSTPKIQILFHRIPDILQIHLLFRIALCGVILSWDREEKIGDVFVASFSKASVLETYSDFINNFGEALSIVKSESKKKSSSLSDFLGMRQITSPDRISLFGLLVKPVQRFPQFILILQDLLKETPHGHGDRMALQLALTTLESLAEMLNERKRESERYAAFKEKIKAIGGKSRALLENKDRYLLREDDVHQLELHSNGLIARSKARRLLLINDYILCVSVSGRFSEIELAGTSTSTSTVHRRYSLKWAVPVMDVEIIDRSTSTLSRLLLAPHKKQPNSNLHHTHSSGDLASDMNELMSDFDTLSRIKSLLSTLKGTYEPLNTGLIHGVMTHIQGLIRQKDEEMKWLESCTLQLSLKSKPSEMILFQTSDPSVKKDWIHELRLAQLALNVNNSPGWDVNEDNEGQLRSVAHGASSSNTKMPLYVRSVPVHTDAKQSQTECSVGTSYTLQLPSPTGIMKTQTIIIYSAFEPERLTEVTRFSVPSDITSLLYQFDSIWIGLSNGILASLKRHPSLQSWDLSHPALLRLSSSGLPISSILPVHNSLYISWGSTVGHLDIPSFEISKSLTLNKKNNCDNHQHMIEFMSSSGVGLWIALRNSPSICLYHTETFRHLQDINIASNVHRVLSSRGKHLDSQPKVVRSIVVSALKASRGLLWVGTNVGIALTVPLPRLEGVPIISGRANISYHAHFGPVTFFINVNTGVIPSPSLGAHPPTHPKVAQQCNNNNNNNNTIMEEVEESPPTLPTRLRKQNSEGVMSSCPSREEEAVKSKEGGGGKAVIRLCSSPLLSHKRNEVLKRRGSKTLPFHSRSLHSYESDVHSLYGDLLTMPLESSRSQCGNSDSKKNNKKQKDLRKSDPDLYCSSSLLIESRHRVGRFNRPKSLDMSSWSVESRLTNSSSGSSSSESSSVCKMSPNVSRNASFISNGSYDHGKSDSSYSNSPESNNNSTTSTNNRSATTTKTLCTLMGGRGYINWRVSTTGGHVNNSDAYLVLWEMKV